MSHEQSIIWPNIDGDLIIGAAPPPQGAFLKGNLDDIHWRNIALSTENFDPPDTPAVPSVFDTKLLISADGEHGSTIFEDSSSSDHTITSNNGASISTVISKFQE